MKFKKPIKYSNWKANTRLCESILRAANEIHQRTLRGDHNLGNWIIVPGTDFVSNMMVDEDTDRVMNIYYNPIHPLEYIDIKLTITRDTTPEDEV